MSKISACVVIHNEEKVLGRCLESLKGVVDEIIVVHDGECSDRSLDIAKEHNAKIFIRPRIGTAEVHRTFSFTQTSHEWVLQIDADEFLPDETRQIIPELIKDESVDAYEFGWPSTNGKKEIGRAFKRNTKSCLLRKSKLYMVAITHEFPKSTGTTKLLPDVKLGHLPNYNNFTFNKLTTKWAKWVRLQAKHIVSFPSSQTYGVDDIHKTKEYAFYRRMVRKPFRVSLKYAYDVWMKVFDDIKLHPTKPIDWQSWKIAILNTLNYAYLGWRVYKERQSMATNNSWWNEE